MQMTVSLLVGLLIGGTVLYSATRKRPAVAVWSAIVLGVVAIVLLLGILNVWFLPRAGALEAGATGLLSGIATALAIGCLARGERKPVNWLALAVALPPVLFLVVFGLGELLYPH